jgi:hypothetical protein
MKRIILIAVLLIGARAAGAQSAAGQSPFVAVGCVALAVHDGSLAGSPGVPPASPNTAPVLANSSEPTGAFMLNGVAPASAAAQTAGAQELRAYVLDGTSAQLQPHVGHRVEVTGRLVQTRTGNTAAEKTPVDRIQVLSVKMLGSECPKPASQQ